MTTIDLTPTEAQPHTADLATGSRHPVVGHDDVMYRTLPFHVSIAAVRARAEGKVTDADFPPSTGDWIADGIAMRAFLEERGLWASYRQELADATFVADCPGWCGVRHATSSTDNMAITHELPVATIVLDDDTEVTVSIQGFQDQETVGEPTPYLYVDSKPRELGDIELTHRDANQLAETFTAAAKHLTHITELLTGGPA